VSTRVCDVEGCQSRHKAKGLCAAHYAQQPERLAATARNSARWYATPEGRTVQAAASARYNASDVGKSSHAAAVARYLDTDKGRAYSERNWVRDALRHATSWGAVIGEVPADTRAILLARFGETCLGDGCTNVATDVDHVIALANGGVHDISNFQTLCGSCNKAKGAETIDYRPHV